MFSGKAEYFDRFEKNDLIMSRTLVESHFSKALSAKLCIRFGHMNKFKAFPGPDAFLMALDICHALVVQDIEGAKKIFLMWRECHRIRN